MGYSCRRVVRERHTAVEIVIYALSGPKTKVKCGDIPSGPPGSHRASGLHEAWRCCTFEGAVSRVCVVTAGWGGFWKPIVMLRKQRRVGGALPGGLEPIQVYFSYCSGTSPSSACKQPRGTLRKDFTACRWGLRQFPTNQGVPHEERSSPQNGENKYVLTRDLSFATGCGRSYPFPWDSQPEVREGPVTELTKQTDSRLLALPPSSWLVWGVEELPHQFPKEERTLPPCICVGCKNCPCPRANWRGQDILLTETGLASHGLAVLSLGTSAWALGGFWMVSKS